MRLVVFHYHLLPGGVTDVITHSIKAVVQFRSDVESVRLVCGREENTWFVVKQLDEAGVPTELDIVPDLDYTSPGEPTSTGLARADALEERFAAYREDNALWWVHNYHIGKNPAFTLALCRIAAQSASPRMVLHIHDFPECARYENLAYLTRIAGQSPYPAGAHVHYVVINERDRAALAQTEIPSDRIHLLVNPLPEGPAGGPERPDRSLIVDACSRFSRESGQHFRPDAPLLLYPVRTIRRKNVLEMALLARLADEANLIVTLPGVSDAERPYSNLVREAFAADAACGLWGLGRREHEYGISFDTLTHGADAIVSSSVQEGFGLLFINALRWRVPLFARYLSVLDGVVEVFEGYPAAFYTEVLVPFHSSTVTSARAYLRMRYTERFDALGALLPDAARERLNEQLEKLLAEETVDFSLLPADLQYAYLCDAKDPGFAREIRALNTGAVSLLRSVQMQSCPDMTNRVEEMFGYGAFARRFSRMIDQQQTATETSAGDALHRGVQNELVQAFADLEFLRLLFAPLRPDHDALEENG